MTFVAEKGLIKHNLIYGLFPGYSLTEKPASDKDKFWNLTSLIRNCDFLRVSERFPPHCALRLERN
jgi:hypothetical protein